MAFEEFTIEGEATLGYFGDTNDKHVRIKTEGDTSESLGERVEQMIAGALNFPNEEEFDQFFKNMDNLRNQGLRPADGVPDLVRQGFRLRIEVETL